MKATHLLLTVGTAGLLSGFALGRLGGGESTDGSDVSDRPPERPIPSREGQAPPERKRNPSGGTSLPFVKSSDTIETLKSLPPEDLYGRLALWMVDADEGQIEDFWQHYRNVGNRDNRINDLIFINWARIDPQSAVNAAAGTPDEHYTWWAWSCHDPEGSLEAVLAQNPGRLNNVTWGLGEFHPDWVREHWEEIPEEGRGNALQGMAKWDDVGNPLEILSFLDEKGYGFHERIFKVLATKDPWAAYEWLQENGGDRRDMFGRSADTFGSFVDIVAEYHPAMLERLVAETPSGKLKWEMESKLFNQLLKSDPEEAARQAMETKAPKFAAERLAAVGLKFVADDPERAFAMAERIFEVSPNAIEGGISVQYEGGSSGWGSDSEGVDRLMSALVAEDPARAMAAVANSGEGVEGVAKVGVQWATRDLDGFMEWSSAQDDGQVRVASSNIISGKLMERGDFVGAADWIMRLGQDNESVFHYRLRTLSDNWGKSDPDAARSWIEGADIPAVTRDVLLQRIPGNP